MYVKNRLMKPDDDSSFRKNLWPNRDHVSPACKSVITVNRDLLKCNKRNK